MLTWDPSKWSEGVMIGYYSWLLLLSCLIWPLVMLLGGVNFTLTMISEGRDIIHFLLEESHFKESWCWWWWSTWFSLMFNWDRTCIPITHLWFPITRSLSHQHLQSSHLWLQLSNEVILLINNLSLPLNLSIFLSIIHMWHWESFMIQSLVLQLIRVWI